MPLLRFNLKTGKLSIDKEFLLCKIIKGISRSADFGTHGLTATQ